MITQAVDNPEVFPKPRLERVGQFLPKPGKWGRDVDRFERHRVEEMQFPGVQCDGAKPGIRMLRSHASLRPILPITHHRMTS